EDVLGDQRAVRLVEELSKTPGARVLTSSREHLGGDAVNITIESLDADSAVQVFRDAWEGSGAPASLPDSRELREFITQDLGCHALSLVLVGAQGKFYSPLATLRSAWERERTALAKLWGVQPDRLSSLDVS